jgi:hypothetical protein
VKIIELTTFGPPQPPCKLKTKTKVCHDTHKKKRKKKPTTMAQNRTLKKFVRGFSQIWL